MKFTAKHLNVLIDLKENRSAGLGIDSTSGWQAIDQMVFLELVKADLVDFTLNNPTSTKPDVRIHINNRGQDVIQQALTALNPNAIIRG